MKYFISTLVLLFVLGAGCDYTPLSRPGGVPANNTKAEYTSFYLEDKPTPQDAVFMLQVGITGGMGSAAVLVESGEYVFMGPIYLRESDLPGVLAAGGGLPDCYVGNPEIIVSANVTVVKKTNANYSLPEPEQTVYYEVQVNEIYDVSISARSC